jgi:hypothetical protein
LKPLRTQNEASPNQEAVVQARACPGSPLACSFVFGAVFHIFTAFFPRLYLEKGVFSAFLLAEYDLATKRVKHIFQKLYIAAGVDFTSFWYGVFGFD